MIVYLHSCALTPNKELSNSVSHHSNQRMMNVYEQAYLSQKQAHKVRTSRNNTEDQVLEPAGNLTTQRVENVKNKQSSDSNYDDDVARIKQSLTPLD